MKKDTSYTIRRVQRLPVILIGEGLLVGAVGGLIVMLYRIALTYAGKWLGEILDFIRGYPLRIAGWFLVLAIFAVIVGRLVKWVPMISGSGIPQVEGEILGKRCSRQSFFFFFYAYCAVCPLEGQDRPSSSGR